MLDSTKNTIFIQLISLKESEVLQTIEDCIQHAKHPENLQFCVACKPTLKYKKQFEKYEKNSCFKFLGLSCDKNKKTSWIKNQLQQQYNNEKYTLQLGGFHKFVKNWDTELINMLEDLKIQGYKKPLLTSALPSFDPKNDPSERVGFPLQINFQEFCSDGTMLFSHSILNEWEKLTSPALGRFCSSYFYFADGSFVTEVPNDPNYINISEEISLAVRAFTHGYDIFHPHKVLIWNYYKGNNKKQIFLKDKQKCLERYYKLLELKLSTIDLDIYNLGKQRTLQQYEKYANISFKHKTSPETHSCSLKTQQFDYVIKLTTKDFLTDPKSHNFWAISFHNSNDVELYRQDAFKEEILSSLNIDTQTYSINRRFESHEQPAYYSIWPNSFPSKWEERIIRPLAF